MGGRKRKPSAIRAAEGNPGKRKIPAADLAASGVTKMATPSWLSSRGKRFFGELKQLAEDLGILANTDRLGLALIADAASTIMDAREILNQTKEPAGRLLAKTSGDSVVRHPLLHVIKDQQSILRPLLAEFGFTPASRARILAGDNPKRGNQYDDLAALLAGEDDEDDNDAPDVLQ